MLDWRVFWFRVLPLSLLPWIPLEEFTEFCQSSATMEFSHLWNWQKSVNSMVAEQVTEFCQFLRTATCTIELTKFCHILCQHGILLRNWHTFFMELATMVTEFHEEGIMLIPQCSLKKNCIKINWFPCYLFLNTRLNCFWNLFDHLRQLLIA